MRASIAGVQVPGQHGIGIRLQNGILSISRGRPRPDVANAIVPVESSRLLRLKTTVLCDEDFWIVHARCSSILSLMQVEVVEVTEGHVAVSSCLRVARQTSAPCWQHRNQSLMYYS